jgi:hypothetical protein
MNRDRFVADTFVPLQPPPASILMSRAIHARPATSENFAS